MLDSLIRHMKRRTGVAFARMDDAATNAVPGTSAVIR